MDQTPYVSPDVLTALTGLSRATIYAALERGEIPSMRIGRRFLIRVADVTQRLGVTPEDIEQARQTVRVGKGAK